MTGRQKLNINWLDRSIVYGQKKSATEQLSFFFFPPLYYSSRILRRPQKFDEIPKLFRRYLVMSEPVGRFDQFFVAFSEYISFIRREYVLKKLFLPNNS